MTVYAGRSDDSTIFTTIIRPFYESIYPRDVLNRLYTRLYTWIETRDIAYILINNELSTQFLILIYAESRFSYIADPPYTGSKRIFLVRQGRLFPNPQVRVSPPTSSPRRAATARLPGTATRGTRTRDASGRCRRTARSAPWPRS